MDNNSKKNKENDIKIDVNSITKEFEKLKSTSLELKKNNDQIENIDDNNSLPPGFDLREDGVYFIETTKEGLPKELKICSYLAISSMTRNADSVNWGREIEFRDADNKLHSLSVPMSLLTSPNELFSQLLSQGLEVNHSRKAKDLLLRYIQETKPDLRKRSVQNIGWYDNTFVLPDETIGGNSEEIIVFQNDIKPDHRFKVKGSLEEWQENIARFCSGNSRLIFCVSTSFAATMLPFCREQGGGFHLVNDTSSGKTTALFVAGSVSGGGDENLGFCQLWATTANGLEGVAEIHNHILLCLDELKQCDPRAAGQSAYLLANGQGKLRMSRDAVLRKRRNWTLLFLSSGEITMQALIEQSGERFYGGQAVRLCDIPASAGELGLFENLHSFTKASDFSDYLRSASKSFYGTALREHIKQLVNTDKEKLYKEWLNFQKNFIAEAISNNDSGELIRVASRFALVGFAGEYCQNITTWKAGEARKAALTMFKAWLSGRDSGENKHDSEMAIRQVRAFIESHGSSRFSEIGDLGFEGSTSNRAGYLRYNKTTQIKEFLVFPEVFRRDLCKKFRPDFVIAELLKRGFLNLQENTNGSTQVIRINKHTSAKRFYVIPETIFEGGTEILEDDPPTELAEDTYEEPEEEIKF